MHVCLISVEIFAWGKYGGFGKATRAIGRELVKRGIQVSAIVPRRGDQKKVEELDGIKVYGFDYRKPFEMLRIFRDCDADIFHSQEPSMGTFFAQKAHPDKKHLITFRDTRLFSDWITEFKFPSKSRLQVVLNWLYEDNLLVQQAVRKADLHVAAAQLLVDKAFKRYRLKTKPVFLPTPVDIPMRVEKAKVPTACYIARWDRRKRPEFLISLAKSFPDVKFIIAGASRNPQYDRKIRDQLAACPNVELLGFVNQFETDKLTKVLSESWIFVNTAAREGLPESFLEACSYYCAILSSVDPDNFATQFGYYASTDGFSTGMDILLKDNLWRDLGKKGYDFVNENCASDKVMDQHVKIYKNLLGAG
jgi:glycosyltransferase involved in cell wall biosynthesis